ncbi:hypothetical protein SDRG_07752 [Saprolegnia diclina VS20]|uniref:GH18 domain-containing protein n=1 Tax=Saprolegnia diclina (strain VS20) TaxID=1156394 RepID=T0QME5_SAPDV|nr:hypothetical protein SDRG_07752 [Saprolegnia diclina VS20]EQC34955.1 hypothetical protein SDRG_07752 [Saprolegnia diclina VS20]|eukprot:XP_008611827.1 hypothetical protein SDRG_07752 [Saprolegnia diclina VS20]
MAPAERDPLIAYPSERARSRWTARFIAYAAAALALAGCGLAASLHPAPSPINDVVSTALALDATLPRRPAHCPPIAPHERVVLFWQSEVGGCEQIPDGVTHVLWGFAQVEAGEVIPRFQTHDALLTSCVQALRARCIYSLGVVGGANNNDGMASIRDPPRFVRSVLSLVDKYQFDGIDIDDETNYREAGYSSRAIVAYMTALRNAFRPLNLLLTYDAYMMEASPHCGKGMRCFAKGVERLVDWVNIMAYNIDRDPKLATPIYEAAVHQTFPQWQRRVPNDKITVGLCTGSGCAWGPGPSPDVVEAYIRYAKGTGGLMIYAGSADIDQGFVTTKAVVARLHPQSSTQLAVATTMTPVPTTVTPVPTTATPAPTTVTPEPTTVTPEPTTETMAPTPEPWTVTPAPTEPGVRPDAICGSCYDCFYEPIKGCFDGWSEAQCKSLSFTWCG